MQELSFITPFINGFGLGASLIIAIGSQNAFVLRQGIKKEYVFTVTTICFICDAILISLGAGGFGTIVSSSPGLLNGALWGGAVFLMFYGFRSFKSAMNPEVLNPDEDGKKLDSLMLVILTTLALSLLNPHVYLDTVLLLGSLAGQFSGKSRLFFTIGAIVASFIWFYGIGYGARILAPLFKKPTAWRILDIIVGFTMWAISASLIWKNIA